MKTSYKLIDASGVEFKPVPYEDNPVLEVVSVEFIPNIGDPDDPDDVDEMLITLRVKDAD